jgi:hypothetical protein
LITLSATTNEEYVLEGSASQKWKYEIKLMGRMVVVVRERERESKRDQAREREIERVSEITRDYAIPNLVVLPGSHLQEPPI